MRKYLPLGVALLVAVATLVALGIGFHQFNEDLAKYCGIRIDDDRDEALYRLGFPPTVLDDSQKNGKYPGRRSYKTNRKAAGDDPDVMPEGKTVADYYEWSYPLRSGPNANANANVYIDFDRATKAIENIDCVDFSDAHLCPSLAGIAVGDSEDRVRERFGKPDRFELDGVTKTMAYEAIGVEYKLTKGSVYYLKVFKSNRRSLVLAIYLYTRGLFV